MANLFSFRMQDWSLNELLGVCSLLNIPFVVIVQAHLLKDKGSVRLRRVLSDDLEIGWNSGGGVGNEQFVALDNLASMIRDMSAETSKQLEPISDEARQESGGANAGDVGPLRIGTPQVECIFVDQEQFFSKGLKLSKTDTPHDKAFRKALKSVAQRSEAFLSTQMSSTNAATPVFGVADLPFWVLREFGSSLMRRERKERSAVGASIEVTDRFPKGKRSLKMLAMAIDSFMKKRGIWDQTSSTGTGIATGSNTGNNADASGGSHLLTILLYSKLDDRFDMLSLENSYTRHGTPTRRR
jgi:hypothetical protein